MLFSWQMAACRVSYVDFEGFRHSVELEAGSLYEAAVLAVSAFRRHDYELGDLTNLEVEIRTAITHTVTLKKVRSWLEGGSRSPKEAIAKDRLKALL
jgi:hypothetical protein